MDGPFVKETQPKRNRVESFATTTPSRAALTVPDMMGKRLPTPAASLSASGSARQYDIKVNAMIHPSEPDLGRPLAVRAGQSAPVTCATCGCRLAATGDAWFHFNPLGGRDARGCRIACADAGHDTSGRAISVNV